MSNQIQELKRLEQQCIKCVYCGGTTDFVPLQHIQQCESCLSIWDLFGKPIDRKEILRLKILRSKRETNI